MQRILESKINTARVDFYKLLGNDDLQITAVPRISVYIYIYNNAIPTLIRRLGLSYSRKKKPDAHNTRRMMFCSSIALMIPMIVYVYVYVYICIYIDSFDN